MHILAIGQSNIASHGETRMDSDYGQAYHAGALHNLHDPVPGGTGDAGSVWTRFADIVRENFILSLRARGGTSIGDWSEGGKCFRELEQDIPALRNAPSPVTHILYHQGERDTLLQTTENEYVHSFEKLYDMLTPNFPDATWVICRASFRDGVTSQDVRRAQNRITEKFPSCIAGPDTDRYGTAFRSDNTHFNEAGLKAFAQDLADCLSERGTAKNTVRAPR